jgi:glutathionyl-hydroquinone reductase
MELYLYSLYKCSNRTIKHKGNINEYKKEIYKKLPLNSPLNCVLNSPLKWL